MALSPAPVRPEFARYLASVADSLLGRPLPRSDQRAGHGAAWPVAAVAADQRADQVTESPATARTC